MTSVDMKPPLSASEEAAQNFLQLVKQLLLEKAYEGIKMLFQNPNEAANNLQHMPLIAMDVYEETCVPNLVDEVNVEQPELFDCANELLKIVAQYAPLEELMLELMEKIEESSSISTFSPYLRALQVVLQRQGEDKPQAVEWCLQSVVTRLRDCPLPSFLSEGYDEAAGHLLEQDKQVENLMAFFITIDLFYQPLIAEILAISVSSNSIFRNCGLTRKNIFSCFFIQLMGKPLAFLKMGYTRDEPTHKYANQVVKSLTKATCSCLRDPFYLLALVEQRARWQRKLDAEKGVYEMSSQNIFLIEEKLPLYAVAMFYHSLFVDNLLPSKAPKIYLALYLFESGLYLVSVLLEQAEPPLQHCGLRLLEYLVTTTLANSSVVVPCSSLQLDVHKRLCESLCKIVGYSPQVSLRQLGLHSLRKYILAFDHEGKYFILKNLIETLQHDGLMGYLASMYKDLVDQAIRANGSQLPQVFGGKQFREMLLLCLCVLPQDVKSDLLLHSDRLCNALNILRFFALRDLSNVTGFWHILPEIEQQLLQPLGKALDFSLAHYKAYKERVENGQSASDDALMQKQLKMLAVNISNSGMASGDGQDSTLPDIGHEEKLDVLCSSITSLESLLDVQISKRSSLPALETSINKRAYAADIKDKDHLESFRAREEEREKKRDKAWSASQEFTKSTKQDTGRGKERYRNEEEAAKHAKEDALRQQILDAALKHVSELGWSRQSIVKGAEQCGYPSVVHGMFPEGGFALVSHFNSQSNAKLVQILQEQTENGQRVINDPLDFLVQAVRQRLEMIVPYKTQWPQAMALIAQPQNASTALAQVLTLVDDICYYSGDRSVDFGWYTRRIGLATIMKMTELYLLQDSSSGHSQTWLFLKHRMDEAVQLQMMLAQTEGMTHTFQRSFNSAFITARNILGLGYNRH